MKKQFAALITILGISASLVGCGSSKNEPTPVPETTVETEVQETETPVEEEAASEETAETPEGATEETNTEENPAEDSKETAAVKEENTEDKKTPSATETAKPNTSTSTSKPSTNSSSSSTSKPSTNGQTTTKPNTNTSGGSTTTTPSTKPEVKPETTPEVTPTPEVKPEATPEVKPETTSLTSSEVFNKITSGIEFPSQMDVDATLLSDLYGIDASLLEDFCVKMPMMSAHLAEVGVFKVKDANNVSSIIAGINQRASNVGQCLYPSLIETFESKVIITKGNYILFAMDENASKIEASFNSLVK